uniref:Probable low-specificity L-threonine aldolase 1 n=1 Tax=Cacopsylla melanoneura TaxID=428564 RepID=A0A8D9BN34_9HEMI
MSSYGISMSAYGSPIEGYPPLGGQIVVDLRSDTISKPTPEMKNYMFNCEVGDDVYLEDPTCKELQEKAAKLAGKESAIFVPSGTMGNLIAIMAHCDRRDSEIIVGDCIKISEKFNRRNTVFYRFKNPKIAQKNENAKKLILSPKHYNTGI